MQHLSFRLGLGLGLGLLSAIVSLTVACGDSAVERAHDVGRLEFPLQGTSASGVSYRLRYGEFAITGASAAVASTEDNPEAETMVVELKPGNYMIELNPGWILEKVTQDSGVVSAQAVLTSDNPQTFTIEERRTSSVQFRFRVDKDVFTLGKGEVAISIEVDETVGGVGGAGGAGGSSDHAAGAPGHVLGAVFEIGPLMQVARMNHETITLQDGRALLLGGHGTGFVSLDSAELFDPVTGSLTYLSMQWPRDTAGVQQLADGRYLIVGGSYDLGVAPGYKTAEIFDSSTLTFSATGDMVRPRMLCDAERLKDGRILVVGGWFSNDSATYGEVYEPTTGTFTATGPVNVPRSSPVLLPTGDGRVVILGGMDVWGNDAIIDQVEVYDPITNAFTVLRGSLSLSNPELWAFLRTSKRADEQRLPDGRYLLLANDKVSGLTRLTVYDPETLEITPWDFGHGGGPLVFDAFRHLAYVPYSPSEGELGIARVDTRTQGTELFPVAGYHLSYAPSYMGGILVDSTRLWFSGGTSCSGSQTNFCPVRDTYFVRFVAAPSQ